MHHTSYLLLLAVNIPTAGDWLLASILSCELHSVNEKNMSSSSSPVELRKSEVLGRKTSQDDSFNKDKEGELVTLDYDLDTSKGEKALKIILLGDSAVGKSKLVERFLLDGYAPQQLSTYALTLYRYRTKVGAKDILIDFWDTAGQERFNTMHRSYYHQAHAAILVFDATRKVTYKNLTTWYNELRQYRPGIPAHLAANKIDENMEVTTRSFGFSTKNNLPLHYVSASDGTNVVRMFRLVITYI